MMVGDEEDGQLVLLYADQRQQRKKHVASPLLSVNGTWALRIPVLSFPQCGE
jgi:hypothetical protein